MTLNFYKVMFSAQEVLDLVAEVRDEPEPCLALFEEQFAGRAEERSRAPRASAETRKRRAAELCVPLMAMTDQEWRVFLVDIGPELRTRLRAVLVQDAAMRGRADG